MSDLIERQDAIDAIRASALKYTGFMEMEMYTDDDAVEAIEGLQSAEPKTGHAETASSGVTVWAVCSECKKPIDPWDNYCRSCGARMNGGEDEE